ncbi:hypothetical protein BJ165DRAFT_178074 [Panaeolus papilionaceus]|nr:hypothetical protein BJ165DRAFT_178074 [Panaeolus papilionaceus]
MHNDSQSPHYGVVGWKSHSSGTTNLWIRSARSLHQTTPQKSMCVRYRLASAMYWRRFNPDFNLVGGIFALQFYSNGFLGGNRLSTKTFYMMTTLNIRVTAAKFFVVLCDVNKPMGQRFSEFVKAFENKGDSVLWITGIWQSCPSSAIDNWGSYTVRCIAGTNSLIH